MTDPAVGLRGFQAGVIGRDAVNHVPGWDDEIDGILNLASPPPPMYMYVGGNLTVLDSSSNVDVQARRGMLVCSSRVHTLRSHSL